MQSLFKEKRRQTKYPHSLLQSLPLWIHSLKILISIFIQISSLISLLQQSISSTVCLSHPILLTATFYIQLGGKKMLVSSKMEVDWKKKKRLQLRSNLNCHWTTRRKTKRQEGLHIASCGAILSRNSLLSSTWTIGSTHTHTLNQRRRSGSNRHSREQPLKPKREREKKPE